MNIQVFKGNMQQVRLLERAQDGCSWFYRSGVVDPVEVCLKIKYIGEYNRVEVELQLDMDHG
jgi:hypothetical protein